MARDFLPGSALYICFTQRQYKDAYMNNQQMPCLAHNTLTQSLTGPVTLSFPHSVSLFASHTFPPALLSSSPLSLFHAQADRKCQVRPGYFRPNWEMDVPPETWHLDMPFILPSCTSSQTARARHVDGSLKHRQLSFFRTFSASQRK